MMEECAKRGPDDDPFLLKTTRALDYALMRDSGLHFSLRFPLPKDQANPEPPGGYRGIAKTKEKVARIRLRLYMAVAGGTALVAPMILMVLQKSTLTSLLTVSISVFIFGSAMSVFTDQDPFEVLTATAAYAAVLVVFVGTNS